MASGCNVDNARQEYFEERVEYNWPPALDSEDDQ
jgi:hypothetical protein